MADELILPLLGPNDDDDDDEDISTEGKQLSRLIVFYLLKFRYQIRYRFRG